MELWNDYEGKLLDGQFRLERLIGPKGRSAFFTTRRPDGTAATIRVIESLNDEDVILARWNSVRQMDEPAIVTILACNKTVLDGVHLVYAVLETMDAELADLLRERPLAPDEARQMAFSVVTALDALHAKGLIHEHVEAESVLAKGEEVKLRGDCVREAPDGMEGDTLRRRDAHDLAMLVGYALTQRRDIGQAKLPRPFDDLVRNGMSGTWGLKEMAAVVRPPVAVAPLAAAAPPAVLPLAAAASPAVDPGLKAPVTNAGKPFITVMDAALAAVAGTGAGATSTASSVAGNGPRVVPARVVAAASPTATGRGESSSAATSAQAVAASLAAAPQAPMRRPVGGDRLVLDPEKGLKSRGVFWAGLAVAALLLVGLIWHFTRVSNSAEKTSAPIATAAPTPEKASVQAPVVATKPSAAVTSTHAAARVPVGHGTGPEGSQWRVVAYTFNREEAAQKKVQMLVETHPELKPEVFTPTGRPPYLVALGGWMSVEQAAGLKSKAAHDGLPRDMYTQNFKGH